MWQVIGHDRVVTLLSNNIRTGRLPHAHLLVGPNHVGKMTVALNMSQALNCLGEEKPCSVCISCQRIAENKHADIQIIGMNGRSEVSIDQIRDMEHACSLRPFEGKCRVFIIDEAENLSTEAANCLLKTLEEPPPYVQIMLLTSNERELLPTLRSRCHKLDLRPLPITQIEKYLIERFQVPAEQARILAKLSAGCPGWAINAINDDKILRQRTEQILTLLQLSSQGRTERLSYASILSTQYGKKKEAVKELLYLWVDWWRDLLLTCADCGDCITNIDLADSVEQEAKHYDLACIKTTIDNLQRTAEALDHNANPRLALEVLVLNLPQRKGG